MGRRSQTEGERFSNRLLFGALIAFLILFFAPLFFYLVEHHKSYDVHNVGDAYGWLVRTLFEGTSPYKVKSQLGFVAYWTVRVAGVSLVAFTTAAIASRFVATVIKRGPGMGTFKGSDHLLICGWSPKGSEIIRELRAKQVEDVREVVVLAERETAPIEGDGITFIRGNPSSEEGLRRAGIDRVSTVIVLADASNGSDEPDDLDARSLLTTLAIESINPHAYSCVEVVKSENRQHFERTHADELVVSAEVTGALLAAAARTHGLTAVVADLLTHPEGQELYRVPAPPEVTGQTMRFALEQMKDVHDSLLVGVYDGDRCNVNPPSSTVIPVGADLLVVRERPI